MTAPLAAAPRPIASATSKHVLSAIMGGGTALGVANYARNHSEAPNADGSSPGRLDRAEAKEKFSGPGAPTTILPLTLAFMAIGVMYGKGRIMFPEKGAVVPAGLKDAAEAAGTKLIPGEGTLTKSFYAGMGGMIFGSFGAREIIFGNDDFQTRHIPVDGNGAVEPGFDTMASPWGDLATTPAPPAVPALGDVPQYANGPAPAIDPGADPSLQY